ncbi:MAG: hypothetical protein ACKOD3_12260 [Phenylobacterium sp.]
MQPPDYPRALRQISTLSARTRLADLTAQLARASGGKVLSGPFKDMILPTEASWSDGDASAKLLGVYEAELHGAVEAGLARKPDLIVNVGCAEGYYAVGLARRAQGARVVAFDIDEKAQEICRGSAGTNGVAGPFEVRGLCQAADLRALVGTASSPLLVVDCEGYETTLLEAAEPLAHCDLIVECHDFTDRNLTETLKGRFAGTHDIALVREGPRDPSAFPMLAKLSSFERWLMVCEWRPEVMHWLVLTSRRG